MNIRNVASTLDPQGIAFFRQVETKQDSSICSVSIPHILLLTLKLNECGQNPTIEYICLINDEKIDIVLLHI